MTDPKIEITSFVAKEEGWVKANRRPLIIGAGSVLVLEAILFCLWHLL